MAISVKLPVRGAYRPHVDGSDRVIISDYDTDILGIGCHPMDVNVDHISTARLPRPHTESGQFTKDELGNEVPVGPIHVELINGTILHVDMDYDEFCKLVWKENVAAVV